MRLILSSLLLVALVTFYMYGENSGIEKRRLIKAGKDQISAITIAHPRQDPLIIEKTGDIWKIVSPVNSDVDAVAIENLLVATEKLVVEKEIDQPEDFSIYGLNTPVVVTVESTDRSVVKLLFGDVNLDGTMRYARVADSNGVSLVDRNISDALIANLFEIRDKRIVKFARDGIYEFTLRRGSKAIHLVYGHGSWWIVAPAYAEADTEKVSMFLDKLSTLTATGFMNEETKESLGLNNPSAILKVNDKYDNEYLVISFGAQTARGGRYASVVADGTETFVRLNGEFFAQLPKRPDAFQDLRYLAIAREDINKIKIKNAVGNVLLEKEGEKWRIIEPFDDAPFADQLKVTELIYALGGKEAEAILNGAMTDPPKALTLNDPEIEITLSTKSGERGEIVFGKITNGKKGYYAISTDRPWAKSVSVDTYQKVNLTAAELQDKRFFKTDSANISKIVVKRLDQTFEVVKDSDGYRLSQPDKVKLSSSSVNRFIWTILGFTWSKIYKWEIPDSSALVLTITVYDSNGKLVNDVKIFEKTDVGYVAVDSELLATIDARFVTDDMVTVLEELMNVHNGS